MGSEGPPLEALLHRLVETPSEFLAEPRIGQQGEVDVAAVVWDVLRDLGAKPPAESEMSQFRPRAAGAKAKRNQLQLVLLTCWILGDSWFRNQPELATKAHAFLEQTLSELEAYLPAGRLLNDPDRREELVRRLLHELDLRPAGETAAQAADRLQTLDSAERERVLREAAKAERRAQAVREAMARAAAQDAANRYGE
jgi:hypothetical protein